MLSDEERKNIVMDSLRHMVDEAHIKLYAFTLLPHEVYFIWQKQPGSEEKNVRQSILKFTAQRIKDGMEWEELESHRCRRKDRTFQFWAIGSFVSEIDRIDDLAEKIIQMHQLPVLAGLSQSASAYRFSSAAFYESGTDEWGLITDYRNCTTIAR